MTPAPTQGEVNQVSLLVTPQPRRVSQVRGVQMSKTKLFDTPVSMLSSSLSSIELLQSQGLVS